MDILNVVVCMSRFFKYTVVKRGKYYIFKVKRIKGNESFSTARELFLDYKNLIKVLYELDLPEEFIKKVSLLK